MVAYRFHPEALLEYAEAANYYAREASPPVAQAFVSRVESAIRNVRESPTRWRIVEEPGVRRYPLRRFPYVVYYRFDAEHKRVTVYAVMHCSREPGYWKPRVA